MDPQRVLDAMSRVGRMDRAHYHLTLGDLIDVLSNADHDLPIVVRDVFGEPVDYVAGICDPHSYRGYYDDLAFQPSPFKKMVIATRMEAKSALDSTFTGYTGGEFRMDADTPLWLADYGNSGRAIVAAKAFADRVVIVVGK